MEETYHVTFSEDNEAISKSSTEGDEINFTKNRSFTDDEFLILSNKVSQCSGNDDYFLYVLTLDPISTTNISIPDNVTPSDAPILQDLNSPNEQPKFTIADDLLILNEHDDSKLVKDLEIPKDKLSTIIEPVSNVEPSSAIISPLAKAEVTSRSRIRIRDNIVASAHKCLYANFLFEIEPKKLIEALEENNGLLQCTKS
nr:hypothetical protein [Tanacetum cinerariifolium]